MISFFSDAKGVVDVLNEEDSRRDDNILKLSKFSLPQKKEKKKEIS